MSAGDRDTLAELIGRTIERHGIASLNQSHVDCLCGWTIEPTPKPGMEALVRLHNSHSNEAVADVLLASDWLTEVKAEAWDDAKEKTALAYQHGGRYGAPRNPHRPYRTTEDTGANLQT